MLGNILDRLRIPLFLLLLAGCGGAPQPRAATGDARPDIVGEAGGVQYEIWGISRHRIESEKDQATVFFGPNRLQIKHQEGLLLFRGDEFGPIKSGDKIVVDATGPDERHVFVNGQIRRPPDYSAFGETLAAIDRNWQKALYVLLAGALLLMAILAVIGQVPLSYNVRNLLVRWKTTAMTALAFTLVVALMSVMMAFVKGMYSLTENSGQPGNVIVLASGSNDEGFSNLAPDDITNVASQEGIITSADGKKLASREVFVVGTQQIPVPKGEKPRRRFVQIRGIEDPALAGELHGLALKPGGAWFSDAGVEEAPGGSGADGQGGQNLIQTVIGSGLASEIGNDRPGGRPLAVGDTFDLADRLWKVVGVLDSSGSTFDSEIWVKRQIAGEYFGKPASYSSMVVRAAGLNEAKDLADELRAAKDTKLNAIPEPEYYSNMAATSRQFLYAIVIVALVMGVGGVFGVMNTMFAAISQRSKDIGVLRILGYRRRHVLISFLLESLVLALVGGLLGCALSWLADGWTARSIISSGGGGKFVVLRLVVNRDILATGLLLSLFMGALGGFIPAISAMRLRALESLR